MDPHKERIFPFSFSLRILDIECGSFSVILCSLIYVLGFLRVDFLDVL